MNQSKGITEEETEGTLFWRKPSDVSPDLWRDALSLREAFSRHAEGSLSEDEFRPLRLRRGAYEQRQDGVIMVRVKAPLGRLTALQLQRLGTLSEKFGDGHVHLTTRQAIELHFVTFSRCPELVAELARVDLTTREACGNAVRNVVGCPLAGVCPQEIVDVTPYGQGIARYFLRHPLNDSLPRKVKIALSGCSRDCALAAISDIGIVAAPTSDGSPRFKLRVGGGLGSTPEISHPLADGVNEDRLLATCEAVLQVLHEHGERKNRQRARLKFLVRRLGMETVESLIDEQASSIPSSGTDAWPDDPEPEPAEPYDACSGYEFIDRIPHIDAWIRANARAQKQKGYYALTIRIPRGNLTAAECRFLSALAEEHGNGTLRIDLHQNLVIPWVHSSRLTRFYTALNLAGLGGPAGLPDVTSCPGARTCRLAITRTADMAVELSKALESAGADTAAARAAVKVSGCPNGCSQHRLAAIGFQGAAATVAGRRAPVYQLFVGGATGEDTRIAQPVARVPAHRVPAVALRLIEIYQANRNEDEELETFLGRADSDWLAAHITDLTVMEVKPGEESNFFRDHGSDEPFSVQTGQGECAS
ncbi:MAG TPA: nitrite/sulfite reductase [Armatimonadota bacterium]|nr:nitrite/sulfite reductase [Armatimonadota bacterium]